jgi:3-oxoadipate enol-lactonase
MVQESTKGVFIDDQGGSGDLILFVHGLGGTSNTFAPQTHVLKHDYHVVAYDLAGSGRSSLPERLTIEQHVEDLTHIATQMGVERFHLIGHSMGTIICQHFAARWPKRVAGMALFGAFPEPPSAARDALRTRAGNARKHGMRPIADTIVANGIAEDVRTHQPAAMAFVRESIMTQSPEGYAKNCEALASATAADLSGIRCAVLLVTGDSDKTAPADTARAMASALAEVELAVVPGCGHWPTIERASHSNYLLAKFFATLRQRIRARAIGS